MFMFLILVIKNLKFEIVRHFVDVIRTVLIKAAVEVTQAF